MNIAQLLTKLKALIYSKSETDSLLGGKANSSHTHTKSQITDFPSLATVATSGSYSDLSNKPTIPTNTNQLTNGSGYLSGTVGIANGGTGATTRLEAAKNLTNENVGTNTQYFFTLTQNWGKVGYASVADAKSVLGVPSKTSQLTNDSSFLTTDTGIKVTKGLSVSTGSSGYWAAMCNSTADGSPTLPATGWWHVLSMDWAGSSTDVTNWCSQLALPTQDGSSLYWRRNDSGGTSINSSTWHKVIDDTNIGSQSVNYANSAGSAKLLAYSHTNEINFMGGRQATCYFNYRNADDDSTGTAATVEYRFCNYGGNSWSNVTVTAGTFKTNNSSSEGLLLGSYRVYVG